MNKTELTLISLSILLFPVLAFAQPTVTISSLSQLVSALESAMWIIFGGVAVVCFVVAGILFLTAGGAPEKIQAARSAALWGVAGVVVGIVAYSIIAIVTSAMQGTGL